MKRAPFIPMIISGLSMFFSLVLAVSPALAQTPPPNDSIGNAVTFSTLPFSATLDTSGATLDPGDVSLLCFGENSNVWYAFTPTTDVSVHLDTAGSDYDATLDVLTDTGMGAAGGLAVVDCSDNTDFTLTPDLNFKAYAGTTYFITVGAHGPGGTLVLTADVFPISVQLDPSVTFDPSTRNATAMTTVTCSTPATITVVATGLRLLTGGSLGFSATDVSRLRFTCDPDHPLTLTQTGIGILDDKGKRRGGPSIVHSTIVMDNNGIFTRLAAQTPVTLTGG